jgi:hypothetical protein
MDEAAALPAPVLAALLGVHITTAIAWSHRAQRDLVHLPRSTPR